jgi:transcription initiation factor TFIIB
MPDSCTTKTDDRLQKKKATEEVTDVLERCNQIKVGDSSEKNLVLAFQYLTQLAVDLSVPSTVLEQAARVYKRIIEKNLVKGRSINALVATALYIGCKENGFAVTTKKLADVSKINSRKITRFYRTVTKQVCFEPQPVGIEKYAEDLGTKLKLSELTLIITKKIAKILQHSHSLGGKDPTGITSAVIYLSSVLSGEKRTQRQIAEVARITEQTIRVRCRDIERDLIFVTRL